MTVNDILGKIEDINRLSDKALAHGDLNSHDVADVISLLEEYRDLLLGLKVET